jgi:hypothetical protein
MPRMENTLYTRFDQIERMFNGEQPWRGTVDRPWASRTHNKKRMTQLQDGSIAFSYNHHRFITWHPDNTVTVCSFDSPQQQNVFGHLTPPSLVFDLACRTGGVAMSCPTDQVRKGGYGWWSRFPRYISKGLKPLREYDGCPDYDDRKANPDVIVFRAEQPVRCALDRDRKLWVPVDVDGLESFEWAEIDKKRSRVLNQEFKLTDFDAYLKAVNTLSQERLPKHEGLLPDDQLIEIIASGDFPKALAHFPRGDAGRNMVWTQQGWVAKNMDLLPPTWSHFGKLRTMLYKREGCLIERSEKLISLPEYTRVRSLLYRFQ